jgi:3'-5' exoribonuclease
LLDQKLINDLKPGDSILSFFVVRKKEVKERKANRDRYLSFEFGDCSGRIYGTLWDDVDNINDTIQVTDIVKVKGNVITYQEGPHLAIEKIRKVLPEDQVDPQQFLPTTPKDVKQLFESLLKILDSIENPHLKKLLTIIFQDNTIAQQFQAAPGAKLWHHNYLGGLLEHTLAVAELCQVIQQKYPQLDRDILIAGGLLHDIGKMSEFSRQGFIDYTTTGRLIGHITIGAQLVAEQIKAIPDFPELLKDKLLHCILSHHGQKEMGSPVVPMTLEAMVLNFADEIDSKLQGIMRIIQKEKKPGKVWSEYVNLLDRFIYLGE